MDLNFLMSQPVYCKQSINQHMGEPGRNGKVENSLRWMMLQLGLLLNVHVTVVSKYTLWIKINGIRSSLCFSLVFINILLSR